MIKCFSPHTLTHTFPHMHRGGGCFGPYSVINWCSTGENWLIPCWMGVRVCVCVCVCVSVCVTESLLISYGCLLLRSIAVSLHKVVLTACAIWNPSIHQPASVYMLHTHAGDKAASLYKKHAVSYWRPIKTLTLCSWSGSAKHRSMFFIRSIGGVVFAAVSGVWGSP